MLKIRRSHDRLIFNMEIPIPGKEGLYIETGPWIQCLLRIHTGLNLGHHCACRCLRPSTGAVLTTKSDMYSSNFIRLLTITFHFVYWAAQFKMATTSGNLFPISMSLVLQQCRDVTITTRCWTKHKCECVWAIIVFQMNVASFFKKWSLE